MYLYVNIETLSKHYTVYIYTEEGKHVVSWHWGVKRSK